MLKQSTLENYFLIFLIFNKHNKSNSALDLMFFSAFPPMNWSQTLSGFLTSVEAPSWCLQCQHQYQVWHWYFVLSAEWNVGQMFLCAGAQQGNSDTVHTSTLQEHHRLLYIHDHMWALIYRKEETKCVSVREKQQIPLSSLLIKVQLSWERDCQSQIGRNSVCTIRATQVCLFPLWQEHFIRGYTETCSSSTCQ